MQKVDFYVCNFNFNNNSNINSFRQVKWYKNGVFISDGVSVPKDDRYFVEYNIELNTCKSVLQYKQHYNNCGTVFSILFWSL